MGRFFAIIALLSALAIMAGCWTHPEGARERLHATSFEKMTDEEVSRELEVMSYILTPRDRQMVELMGAVESRDYLKKFWSNIDPSDPTVGQQVRRAYLERVNTAIGLFTTVGQEGWRSDRGRVYCLWGDPQDTYSQSPHMGLAKPIEIWYYTNLEGGVFFVFADKDLTGNYVQVHSTKAGEPQDTSWERQIVLEEGPRWLERVFR